MKHNRKTEFLLLLAVQIVLIAGLALVFLGKQATTPFPTPAIEHQHADGSADGVCAFRQPGQWRGNWRRSGTVSEGMRGRRCMACAMRRR